VLYKAPIGKCYSVLAKDCSDDKPRFVVLMKALNADGQDKKVKVITPEQTIECQAVSSGSKGKKLECKIDGQQVNENSDYNDFNSENQDNINNNGNGQRVVEYNNDDQTDVTINVEGVSVRLGCWCSQCKCQKAWIKISNQYKEGQCGLCGHYDDQADNDLRMGNNEETDDLQQFHRSFSLQDDQCSNEDQNEFYGQKNMKKFGRFNMDQQRRLKKSTMMNDEDEDFDNESDIEWQAGGYESSEEGDQWSQQQSKPWKKHQQKHRQERRQRSDGEEEPISQTKVIEFNHKICFSAQPVKQCPEGTSSVDEVDETSQTQQQQQAKKIQFICLSRSSSEARRLQRQAREGVNVDLPDQSPTFVEAVAQPTRCVAY